MSNWGPFLDTAICASFTTPVCQTDALSGVIKVPSAEATGSPKCFRPSVSKDGSRSVAVRRRAQLDHLASDKYEPQPIFILADDLGYGDLGCYAQKLIQRRGSIRWLPKVLTMSIKVPLLATFGERTLSLAFDEFLSIDVRSRLVTEVGSRISRTDLVPRRREPRTVRPGCPARRHRFQNA